MPQWAWWHSRATGVLPATAWRQQHRTGDALTPTNNFFNSTISNAGVYLTAKTPNYNNQLGFDAKVIQTSGVLANGADERNDQLQTSQDQYFPGVVTTAIDLYGPRSSRRRP